MRGWPAFGQGQPRFRGGVAIAPSVTWWSATAGLRATGKGHYLERAAAREAVGAACELGRRTRRPGLLRPVLANLTDVDLDAALADTLDKYRRRMASTGTPRSGSHEPSVGTPT